jgi:hypothetical protein
MGNAEFTKYIPKQKQGEQLVFQYLQQYPRYKVRWMNSLDNDAHLKWDFEVLDVETNQWLYMDAKANFKVHYNNLIFELTSVDKKLWKETNPNSESHHDLLQRLPHDGWLFNTQLDRIFFVDVTTRKTVSFNIRKFLEHYNEDGICNWIIQENFAIKANNWNPKFASGKNYSSWYFSVPYAKVSAYSKQLQL